MAPKLVFIYFDLPGAGEATRWALVQSGLEWEDKRLSMEQFGELKPILPNGQVPILEVDGYRLPQSLTIIRYVGRIGGLYPTDDLEAAKCDAFLDFVVDLKVNYYPAHIEKDEAEKAEMKAEFVAHYLRTWLGNLERALEQTGGLYFLDKMTVADIAVANSVWSLKRGSHVTVPPSIFEAYPNLVALTESILAEPSISDFIAKTETSK
ncbi:unnamed protein product [Ascophyllum nodosum]